MFDREAGQLIECSATRLSFLCPSNEQSQDQRRQAVGMLQVRHLPRHFICPSFAGHPCDLTLRPTRQASPQPPARTHTAHALFPRQSAPPWAATPSLQLSMQLTLACITSLICPRHAVHNVSGACGGPYHRAQHSEQVVRCYAFRSSLASGGRGVARGTAFTAAKSVLPAMAIRGLQLRGPEAALEQSCGRLKLEQARTIAI